jgi:hypothetical protein
MSKDDYLNRKIQKQLDEMKALQNVHKKELGKNETWKEVKKVQRYFKSSLYAIKNIDRGIDKNFNTDYSSEC